MQVWKSPDKAPFILKILVFSYRLKIKGQGLICFQKDKKMVNYEVWAVRTTYKDEEEMLIFMLEYFICISLNLF